MPVQLQDYERRRDDRTEVTQPGLRWDDRNFLVDHKLVNGETAGSRREGDMVTLVQRVVGVVLRGESSLGESRGGTEDYDHVLGTIVLSAENIAAEELRREMCTQLPTLPVMFIFLTKEGWPVQKHQENVIRSSHLITERQTINIVKQFDLTKVGVKALSGESFGFIFAQLSWDVRQVRDALDDQLRGVSSLPNGEYKFVERNGWPVAPCQEKLLTFLDIFYRNHIHIQPDNAVCLNPPEGSRPATTGRVVPSKGLLTESRKLPPDMEATDTVDGIRKSFKGIISRNPGTSRKGGPNGDLVAKPVLISYARAEASKHALELKAELSVKGFSVYLDVDEIKTGADWQDALNYAVSNCQFFVPLITPSYGKTQWTNREVKLADVLHKSIIPVNFLDYWPPECLAIQFASTQYIASRPPESSHVGGEAVYKESNNPRTWNPQHVKIVSEKIAERCKMFIKQREASVKMKDSVSVAPLTRQEIISRGPSNSLKRMKSGAALRYKLKTVSLDGEDRKLSRSMPPIRELSMEEKNLVVVSVHPKQQELAFKLQVEFEKDGYEVWCSTEMHDAQDQVFYDSCPTPRDLPSIPEGETVFSQLYNMEEKEKKREAGRIESEPDRKPVLMRMSSQISDISQMSSITPDKLRHMKTFQQKADQAVAVIVIISANYTKSKTSQKQVYYCEHRKHVVMVKYDQSDLPSWFKMLMGNDTITTVSSPQFMSTLKAQVKRGLNPTLSVTSIDKTAEAKIQFLVNYVKKSLPPLENCVYIAGSYKLQTLRAEQICRSIAKELAKMKNITLVTGGFFGAADIVGRTFYNARGINSEIDEDKDSTSPSQEISVIHLLPLKDSKDFTHKANQNQDGSFEPADYGHSIFVGESVRERETVVARLFDTCIVIEGGLGAAHEVEEFIWNDHFVIPVISTGGAAAGQYGVPVKIFEPPPCVMQSDWFVLQEKEASATRVATAIFNIVSAIKETITSPTRNHTKTSNLKVKSRVRASRPRSKRNKSMKEQNKAKDVNVANQEAIELNNVPNKTLAPPQEQMYDTAQAMRYGKWQRFLRYFSASKSH